MKHERTLQKLAWGLSVLMLVLTLVAWGSMYEWQFSGMTTYQLFPLFGLLAFGLMWTHYIMDAIRKYQGLSKDTLRDYFDTTSAAVLVFILAHPGLLVWQLWRDGHGLPPESYKAYVGSALYGFVVLGVIALITFVAYEFRNFFKKPAWKQGLQYASDVAMVLIVVHGFRLGSVIAGWFTFVWIGYAVTFTLALVYVRMHTYLKRS